VLHGHFHYADHVGDFVRARCERVALRTHSDDKLDREEAEIRAALKKIRAEADIRVPNRGRDIGPSHAFNTIACPPSYRGY
jgi:hypothetical protein